MEEMYTPHTQETHKYQVTTVRTRHNTAKQFHLTLSGYSDAIAIIIFIFPCILIVLAKIKKNTANVSINTGDIMKLTIVRAWALRHCTNRRAHKKLHSHLINPTHKNPNQIIRNPFDFFDRFPLQSLRIWKLFATTRNTTSYCWIRNFS